MMLFDRHVVISAFALRNELERVIGFEPMVDGFANRRLWPLGYTRENLAGTAGLEPAKISLKG